MLEGGTNSIHKFNQPQPRFCVYGVPIRLLACGDEHAAFVTNTNFIYTMGNNRSGQLGVRDTSVSNTNSPMLVEQMQGFQIVSVSCGGNHTVVATDRGEVYSWGEGRYGALGVIDTETDQHRPQKVIFQEDANCHEKVVKVVQVSAGHKHTAFLDDAGVVFACGNNELGQLGIASRSVQQMPKQMENFDHEAKMVSCGIHHTLILTTKGHVYGVGANTEGQLGVNSEHPTSITPLLVEDISHIPMS